MKKNAYRQFNMQFHMLPEELVSFIQEMMLKHQFNLELERWFPRRKVNIAAGNQSLMDEIEQSGFPDRIWLLIGDDELKRDGEYLMLNVGKLVGNALAETQLGGRTKDEQVYKVWSTVGAELKRRAPPGGWLVNPSQKLKQYYKTCHFSRAAADASRRGEIVLKDSLGAQSPNYLVPDEPQL
jgi:hypothetical protein